jgi:hypothetical protein
MKSLENLVLFLTLQIATVACVGVSPKLDFDEQSELIQVKKEISGKIKGLKVTVDTSELKGVCFCESELVNLFQNKFQSRKVLEVKVQRRVSRAKIRRRPWE